MLADSLPKTNESLIDLLSALVEFAEVIDLGLVVFGDFHVRFTYSLHQSKYISNEN